MTDVELTNAERDLLQGYRHHAPHLLMRKKADALILLDLGTPIEIIATFVEREPPTIHTWATAWATSRIASIYTGHAGNLNASKLTKPQRDEVATILSHPPTPDTLPTQFWKVPTLKSWLEARFDVVYESPSSYHFLLRLAGLSFHKPEAFDRRRGDETAIDARIAAIRAEIAPHLADPDRIVVAADEVRIDQEAILRRAWYARGTKTKLKVERRRASQSYIGFLNQETGECELDRLDWQNGPLMLEALERLVARHPGKRITIVWDNASWHKAAVVREELGPGKKLERLHLVNFPPYAPDHNPIEHVWGEAKQAIANIQRESFDATRAAFEAHVRSRVFEYKI